MRFLSLAASFVAALCSSASAQDTSVRDTSVRDTSVRDTNVRDTSITSCAAELAHPPNANEPLIRARGLFAQARSMHRGEAQRRLYRDSARAFIQAADALPQRAAALTEGAATALQRAGLHAAAARVFERNVLRIRRGFEENPPDPSRHALLAYSMFFVAFNRGGALDHEGSLDAYAALLIEPLLSRSGDARIVELIANAAFNRALTLDWLRRYAQAGAAYRAAVALQTDNELRRTAEYGIQRMQAKRRPARAGARLLLRFARRHADEPEYGRFVAMALLHAADAFRDAALPEQEERVLQMLAAREPAGDERRLAQVAADRLAHPHQVRAPLELRTWRSPAIAD